MRKPIGNQIVGIFYNFFSHVAIIIFNQMFDQMRKKGFSLLIIHLKTKDNQGDDRSRSPFAIEKAASVTGYCYSRLHYMRLVLFVLPVSHLYRAPTQQRLLREAARKIFP